MNYWRIGITLTMIIALVVYVAPAAQAQESDGEPLMTDRHIQRIKQNCRSAARTIQQIHVNDGPLRVNRGQAYESVLSKLITPFNSRLIINKYDASSMVRIASQYDKSLTAFRENYKKYDNQMTAVLRIDCVKRPISFYDAVTEARRLRTAVNADAIQIHNYITEYGQAVTDFRAHSLTNHIKGDDAL
ncbi:MAG: hypothetical protein WAS27_01520 [Candidatus Saccharimonadales bacterium]